MGKIIVDNIRVYAYHGCLREESIIGSDYLVNVTIGSDLSTAAVSDNLLDTVDYVHINRIVKEEMKTPSKLLEHVAKRIIDRIFLEIKIVAEVEVSVSKINPPIGGDVASVTIAMKETRE
ncbi:MAG: dihydroneopterin aldolase [Saonia sp.]